MCEAVESLKHEPKKPEEKEAANEINMSSISLGPKMFLQTLKKLLHENLYDAYEEIFLEWLHEGIIEEVPVNEITLSGNYLPHRPILKESNTTSIWPVFYASALMKEHPPLNESLHSGPNLIEVIPDILLRFKEKKIVVSADIRKAFLQISIYKEDRDFYGGKIKISRNTKFFVMPEWSLKFTSNAFPQAYAKNT
ncbi:hypothetical protein AVEN_166591-1 [Araneus ventricosus]|uniref:Reverse transcriptase domain-containing protein n=1 Tax=Araneus ventricosus TaxID=182803 RepID=A0A4Y2KK74_ARAVE|nr:hypothetical protein AVEN_166591-1 [Araneus ventricosus]